MKTFIGWLNSSVIGGVFSAAVIDYYVTPSENEPYPDFIYSEDVLNTITNVSLQESLGV